MPKSKIKGEFAKEHVAFGKGGHGLKLGQRDDIDKLAIIALKSGNRHLLRYFEQPMPSLDELLKDEADAQLKKAPAPATQPAGTTQAPANTTPTAPPADTSADTTPTAPPSMPEEPAK